MARRGTGWSILLLGLVVAALAGCSLLETAMGPGEDAVVGEPGLTAGLEDGDLWVAKDAYASVEALPRQGAQAPEFVPGQLIVKFRVGQYSDANVNSLASKYTLKTSGKNKSLRLALVTVPTGTTLEDLKARLAADPKVESVGLNQVYRFADVDEEPLQPQAVTNDDLFEEQWALWQIGYNKIPTSYLPTTGVTIAVVDSGVDYTHPDIGTAKVIKGPDYYEGDMDPQDGLGHGTHVAGIAAALTGNNAGVAGVSGKSQILAIRVGYYWIPTFAGAAGITYAADNPSVKVINCSWGGSGTDPFIADAVNYATVTKGKLVVAAAGNDDSADPLYPSAYPNVLSVGATYVDDDWNDVKADFSNWGSTVDIAAPGQYILSTVPVGLDPDWPYWYKSGTSMASPLVAGAAAVVWAKWPTLTAAQVQALLVTTAVTGILPAQTAPFNAFEPDVGRLDLHLAFHNKIPTLPAAGGAIGGRVIDASVSSLYWPAPNPGLAGATVTAKVGATVVKTATTRASGRYTITDLPPGNYTLSVSKAGYCTTPSIATVPVWAGDYTWITRLTCFSLPKVQPAGTYTAVLQWRDTTNEVSILDSTLWLPESLPDRQKYSVYYFDRGILNIHPFARFVRDSMSGWDYEDHYEAHLVSQSIVFKGAYAGKYRFGVFDEEGVYEGTYWEDARAIVRLYTGGTFKQAFEPQVSSPDVEDWWPVFELTWPGGTVVAGFPSLGYYEPPSVYPGPYAEGLGSGALTHQAQPAAARGPGGPADPKE